MSVKKILHLSSCLSKIGDVTWECFIAIINHWQLKSIAFLFSLRRSFDFLGRWGRFIWALQWLGLGLATYVGKIWRKNMLKLSTLSDWNLPWSTSAPQRSPETPSPLHAHMTREPPDDACVRAAGPVIPRRQCAAAISQIWGQRH